MGASIPHDMLAITADPTILRRHLLKAHRRVRAMEKAYKGPGKPKPPKQFHDYFACRPRKAREDDIQYV